MNSWKVTVRENGNCENSLSANCGSNPTVFNDSRVRIFYIQFMPRYKTVIVSVDRLPARIEAHGNNNQCVSLFN